MPAIIIEYVMVLLTFMPDSSVLTNRTQHQFPTQIQCDDTRQAFEEMLQDLLSKIKDPYIQTYLCIPTNSR